MTPKNLFACSIAILGLALAPAVAHALPFVGQPSPYPGFGSDDGTELWDLGDAAMNVETFDYFGGVAGVESSFGFYRASDPTTLITIFSAADQDTSGDGSNPQTALIDFINGQVIDLDEMVVESIFTPGDGEIGFFLHVVSVSTSDELDLFTQPALNSAILGEDAFATWPSETDPGVYLLGAEFNAAELALRIDLVSSVTPAVPEPEAALVFTFGFLVIGAAIRRRDSLPDR
jgi:hypothetical protein